MSSKTRRKQRHKERMATDPDYRRRHREAAKRSYKRRRQRDPEFRKRDNRDDALRTDYGITLKEYELLREAQNNTCGICGRQSAEGEKPLCVDHDHETGYIRGLLCFHCNVGIGHLQDDVALVLKAAAWLTAHS